MSVLPVKTYEEKTKGAVCLCYHCESSFGATGGTSCANFCANCKTEEQRLAMDRENEKLWEEKGLGQYRCKYHEALKAQKESKA